jgi:hypothetical protein
MADEPGSNPFTAGLRGIISEYIDNGFNATGALDDLRGNYGLGVTTQDWYDMWGETAAAKANAGHFFDVDYASPLGADQFVEWQAGRAGTYAHQVGVVVRDLETGEQRVAQYTALADHPLTPQEAVDEALGIYEAGTEAEGGTFPERVRGGFLMNAYVMTGRAR